MTFLVYHHNYLNTAYCSTEHFIELQLSRNTYTFSTPAKNENVDSTSDSQDIAVIVYLSLLTQKVYTTVYLLIGRQYYASEILYEIFHYNYNTYFHHSKR